MQHALNSGGIRNMSQQFTTTTSLAPQCLLQSLYSDRLSCRNIIYFKISYFPVDICCDMFVIAVPVSCRAFSHYRFFQGMKKDINLQINDFHNNVNRTITLLEECTKHKTTKQCIHDRTVSLLFVYVCLLGGSVCVWGGVFVCVCLCVCVCVGAMFCARARI